MSTGLPSLYPRLLADIGGTNLRLALETAPGVLEEIDVYSGDRYGSLAEAVRAYLAAVGAGRVAHAAFGVATAVTGDTVRMTNRAWSFSIDGLRHELGLTTLLVLNDFSTMARALPHLPGHELTQVGGGAPVAGCPLALIGPGTGLGVSALVPAPGGAVALAGEGGHVAFAPVDDEEVGLWQFARREFEHVSAERFLSGPGLALIHRGRLALQGLPPEPLTAAEITRRALGGECGQCRATLDRFCGMLGTAAANLALSLGARGGVYLGGGIVPRLGDEFVRSPFRRRFEAAGRLSGYLAAVPVYVIHSPYPGLIGVEAALADHLRE